MSLTLFTSPSSKAIISDIGFITDPGSNACTALLRASPYVPSSRSSMLDIALISPVATSMSMAVPHSAFDSWQMVASSCSSMSWRSMSMVVWMSNPLLGGLLIQLLMPEVSATFLAVPGLP